MAKRGGRWSSTDRLGQAAEDLGTFFGTVARRVETWVGERDRIAGQLRQAQKTAGDLLGRLGAEMPNPFGRGRKRRLTIVRRGRKRNRRTVSAATRRKMALAQRRRRMKEKSGK